MSSDALTLEQIETIAIESLARVRGDDGMLARRGKLGVNMVIVPAGAKIEGGFGDQAVPGLRLTIQLLVHERPESDGAWTVRDIKEQEVACVPGDADDERLPAYFEGIARSLQGRMNRGDDIDTFMPHDLFPRRAGFFDPACTTAETFAAYALAAKTNQQPTDIDITDLSGTEPIAVNEALERAIADDPERIENHQVYADWLTERGDPRGELITCTLPNATPRQARRAAQLLAQHERYFWGNLDAEPFEEFLHLSWKRGWFSTARLWTDWQLAQSIKDFVPKALAALMRHPSSKLIEELIVGCFDHEGRNDYSTIYAILAECGPRKSMRSLFFGDMTSEEQEVSWVSAGDLKLLNGLYPNLAKLKLRAGSMTLEGGLDYPKLQSLVIESGGISKASVRAVANQPFPELTHLELWLGTTRYNGDSSLEDVLPILSGEHLPKLETLALCNCEYTDEICRALADSPIASRIKTLDLSKGLMTDAGCDALLAKRSLSNLTTLDVSENYIEDKLSTLRELVGANGAPITLLANDQKGSADDDWRYVSLSE